MTDIKKLLTEHIDIWTAADTQKKSGRGRASGNAGSVYGVKKLRELILELAVRGKLVPQDPNDEPASELLKRIQAEKTKSPQSISKRKSTATSTPPFEKGGQGGIGEEEKPFELPIGWEWVRVSNLAEIKGGKRLPEGKTFSPVRTSNIYIQVTNMKHGTVIEESLKYIDDETKEILKNYTISSEDLYITIAGTIGDVGTVPEHFNGMILTENAAKIVFNFLDKNWFKYCFSSNFLGEQFREKTIQLAQPKLALHRVASSVIALPPLDEQHRIVAKVDELMALCDQLEQQHSNAQEAHESLVSQLLATLTHPHKTTPPFGQRGAGGDLNWQRIYAHFDALFTTEASIDALKQTLLQLAVMGKLVPQDPNDEPASELLNRIQAEKAKLIAEGKHKKEKPLAPISEDEKSFELPKGWEWTRFNDLINPLYAISYGVLVPGLDETDGIPFVRIADLDINNPPIKPEKSINSEIEAQYARTRLEGGEILMGVVGSIGKLGVAPESWKGANIARAICRIKLSDSLNKEYVLWLLQSAFMQNNFIGDTKTLTQPTLNIALIRLALTPLPPLEEQHRIVAKVDALMALCDQLKTRIQQANQQQQAIADALVAQAVA